MRLPLWGHLLDPSGVFPPGKCRLLRRNQNSWSTLLQLVLYTQQPVQTSLVRFYIKRLSVGKRSERNTEMSPSGCKSLACAGVNVSLTAARSGCPDTVLLHLHSLFHPSPINRSPRKYRPRPPLQTLQPQPPPSDAPAVLAVAAILRRGEGMIEIERVLLDRRLAWPRALDSALVSLSPSLALFAVQGSGF